MEVDLTPIMIFLGAFALAFGIRYLSNKEKMAMIERGINPGISTDIKKPTPSPFWSLKFGLLFVGVGLGLLLAMVTSRMMFGEEITGTEEGQQVAIFFGFITLMGGAGLIISYLVEKKWMEK
ncbi:MAG: hypothetical protein K2Q03_07265 [Sphingobacteriaceae bacterium]|nr:hypothetical protein [Sphingobacteriaceae bacterium]